LILCVFATPSSERPRRSYSILVNFSSIVASANLKSRKDVADTLDPEQGCDELMSLEDLEFLPLFNFGWEDFVLVPDL
jgi:hypothetical protein